MKKIVLLAINAKYVHSSLSVWLIAAGITKLSRNQHDVKVVEATINQPCSDIANAVAIHEPDIVGISSYIWNAGILPELLELLKKQLPDAVIVLGGPEASHNIEHWLENGADHVLPGEGEYVFPQFLDSSVDSHMSPGFIDPYTEDYFNALDGRLSYIETSRGCPFNCSFCLSAGSEVKYFPVDIIKEQIVKLSKTDTKTIKFVDRTFNCNAERAYELFDFIIGLETSCCFHFEAAADLFDEQTLLLLETAPPARIQFEIGVQSFYEPALSASVRQTDINKAEQNIRRLLKNQNIHIHIDLIAGLPHETLSDFSSSFDRAYALDTHYLQLGFLKLLHGSALRKQADALGIIYNPAPPYEIISSPWLCSEDIQTLKHVENALTHTRNKGRFLSALYYVLAVTGESPFKLMHSLGRAIPNHGTQLEDYVVQVYDFFAAMPNVDSNDLKDCMVYDWFGMVKGKNTPDVLKNKNKNRTQVTGIAESVLDRKIGRLESAVLCSGKGVFVDSSDRDPVTGLYKVYICE